MTETPEVKDILSLIKSLDNASSFEVEIPSLQKKIPFKQLTTEQLKRVLKTVIDSPIYNTEFILTFNSIIKENCLDKEVSVDNLTAFDKLLVLFKTRIESISPELVLSYTDEEKEQYKLTESSKKINLQEHFTSFIEKGITFDNEIIDVNGCKVTCSVPTIQTENKLEKELHKNTKLEINTPEELRNVVGETFINELVKFISQISIEDKVVDLLALPFKTRIGIVEGLPTNLINKVIKYIERYREGTRDLLTVKISTDNGVFVKDIPQDASFFNM
jgi:hypothetical protein